MGEKLTPRQQAQLAWLGTLPRKFERITKIFELLATNHASDTELRAITRLLDELKAQAGSVNLPALGDNFGYMGMLIRRPGGHQVKVRGLRELLVGTKINFEGAMREASIPQTRPEDAADEVSP